MRAMPTRRILLKTTAKLAASSAFALNRATLARANLLGDAAAGTLPEVDVVLRTAVPGGCSASGRIDDLALCEP